MKLLKKAVENINQIEQTKQAQQLLNSILKCSRVSRCKEVQRLSKIKRYKNNTQPPYCQSVKTSIRKKLFDLIDNYFKNNCQVSYCCMQNVKSSARRKNKKVLKRTNKKKDQDNSLCNIAAKISAL